MTELITRLLNFLGQFKLMTIVLPWERAARVRLGNRLVLWEPGWHVRLPFIDHVELLNSRLRVADSGSQTLTTVDGHALTVQLSIGFRIADPMAALLKMHHPEMSCSAIAASVVAGMVSEARRGDIRVQNIESHVAEALQRETTYEIDFVRVRNFVFARTYRLLNDNGYSCGLTIEERKV